MSKSHYDFNENRDSALRWPLNQIFGSEANVRILRLITQSLTPIRVAVLAREVAIDETAAQGAITALKQLGVIEAVRSGREAALQPRRQCALSRDVADLFRRERDRFDDLMGALSTVAQNLAPPPMSVWIEGPVAIARDQTSDSLAIGILAEATYLPRLRTVVRRATTAVAKHYDVAVVVRLLSTDDLAVMEPHDMQALKNVRLLAGSHPHLWSRKRTRGMRSTASLS
jgi:hypothetical protein